MTETPIAPQRPRRRARRVLAIVGITLAAVLVLAIGGFVIWANTTYSAEPKALAAVQQDDRVQIANVDGAVVMTPTEGANGRGLVFFAGAKVEPEAYAATFRDAVAAGETVVIVQSFLNLPLFETREFSEFTRLAPHPDTWAVGGHSMGGVKACMYAADGGGDGDMAEVNGLVLFASYCADDALADRDDLEVLSVSATNDGLATPAKIQASVADLPADTEFVEIEGGVHAQFGAYGEQSGDGEPTISDDEARSEITGALLGFLEDN